MKNIYTFLLIFLTVNLFGQKAELITQEKNLGIISCIDYSADGRYIAVGSDKDFTIKIWDVQSGKMIGALYGHEALINDVSFHPSGNFLISLGTDEKNYVWDLNSWDLKDSIIYGQELLKSKFSKDGKIFYAGSEDHNIVYWENENYTESKKLGTVNSEIRSLFVNEKYVVASSTQNEVEIWDINNHDKLKKFKPNGGAEVLGMFIIDNQLITGDQNGKVVITDLSNFKQVTSFEAHKAITSLTANQNKKLIATAGSDKTVKVWDFETQKLITTFSNVVYNEKGKEIDEKIRDLIFSPEGSILATSGYKAKVFNKVISKDNSIKLYDVERQRLYKTLIGNVVAPDAFCFSPSENYFYTVNDSMVKVWDLNVGERIAEVPLHERKTETVFNNEEEKEDKVNSSVTKGVRNFKNIALNGTVPKIKLEADKVVKKTTELGEKVTKDLIKKDNTIYVSEAGNLLVTKFENDDYRLYSLENGIPVYKDYIKSYIKGGVNAFAVSPDEKVIVFAGGGEEAITVVNLETGKKIRSLTTGTEDKTLNDARALAFSNDGSQMAVVSNSGMLTIYRTSSWSKIDRIDLKGGVRKKAYISYSKSSDHVFIQTLIGIISIDSKTFAPKNINSSIEGQPVALNHPSDYIVSKDKKGLYFYNTQTKAKTQTPSFNTKMITHMEINKFGYLGVCLKNGELKIYDPATGKERFLMVSEGENAIFKTPENYYKITKEGTDLVTFRVGKDAYPFEQFDAKFNRPDIVLEAMNSEDEGLVNLYKKAYKKRLAKLGVSDGDLTDEMHIPKVKIKNMHDVPLVTSQRELILNIEAYDDKHELMRINVWLNDVPVFGSNGIKIATQKYNDQINIKLAAGLNKIQISATNSKGGESLKETIEVDCDVEVERNLYVVSIGTSQYKDKRFNLNYAAKDAHDIAELLNNSENKLYKNIYEKVLTNEQVKKDNFRELKAFLSQASIDDLVLVFIAGHGVLDSKLDYYYGTHDIDFNKPEVNGLRYEEVENILDGIEAIRKLLIMDTCHSGEVEKDEVAEAESEDLVEGDVMFRSVGNGVKEINEDGVSPSKMAKELFADLRRGTGTTVISSAGGAEFAMESSDWKNGLFTYCLLSGLRNRTADMNKDGKIMLTELQIYVTDKVTKLSHGRQVPTSRIQNIALDYQIW